MGFRVQAVLLIMCITAMTVTADDSSSSKVARHRRLMEQRIRENDDRMMRERAVPDVTRQMLDDFFPEDMLRGGGERYFNRLQQKPEMVLDTPLCGELKEFAAFISLCNFSDSIISYVVSVQNKELLQLLKNPKTFGQRFLYATASMDINARRKLIEEFAQQIFELDDFYRMRMADFLWADLFWASDANPKSAKAITMLRKIAKTRYQSKVSLFLCSEGLAWLKQYYASATIKGEELKNAMLSRAAELGAMGLVICPEDYVKILDAASVVGLDKSPDNRFHENAIGVKSVLRGKIFGYAQQNPTFLPLALKALQNPQNGNYFGSDDFSAFSEKFKHISQMIQRAHSDGQPKNDNDDKQDVADICITYDWCKTQLMDYGIDVPGPVTVEFRMSRDRKWDAVEFLKNKISKIHAEQRGERTYLNELLWAVASDIRCLPNPESGIKLAEYNWKGVGAYRANAYGELVTCILETINDTQLSESWKFWRMMRVYTTTHGYLEGPNVKLMEPIFTVFPKITPEMISSPSLRDEDFLKLTPLMNFDSSLAIKNAGEFAQQMWARLSTAKDRPTVIDQILLANLAFIGRQDALGLEIMNRDIVFYWGTSDRYYTPELQRGEHRLPELSYTYILLSKHAAARPLLKKWFVAGDYYTFLHPWERNFTEADAKAVSQLLTGLDDSETNKMLAEAWLVTNVITYGMDHEKWNDYYKRSNEVIHRKYPTPEIATRVYGIMSDVNGRRDERDTLYANTPVNLAVKMKPREVSTFFNAYARKIANLDNQDSVKLLNEVLAIKDNYFLKKAFAYDVASGVIGHLANSYKHFPEKLDPKALDEVIRIIQPYLRGESITKEVLESGNYYNTLRNFGQTAGMAEYLLGNRIYANGLFSSNGEMTQPLELDSFQFAGVFKTLLDSGVDEKKLTENLIAFCDEYKFRDPCDREWKIREIISGLFYRKIYQPGIELYKHNRGIYENTTNIDKFQQQLLLICKVKLLDEGKKAADEYIAQQLAENKITYSLVCQYYDGSGNDPEMYLKYMREGVKKLSVDWQREILRSEANAYKKMGQPLKAAATLEKYAKEVDSRAFNHLMSDAADWYAQGGDYDNAIRCIKELIAWYEKNGGSDIFSKLYERWYKFLNLQQDAKKKSQPA